MQLKKPNLMLMEVGKMSRKILVVDDDPMATTLLGASLGRAGYEVVSVHNAASAEAELMSPKHEYDAIIIDYHMPGDCGDVLAKNIKASGKTMPLIGATGGISGEVDLMIDAGCCTIIKKPYSLKDICQTLEHVLEEAPIKPQSETQRLVAETRQRAGLNK